MPEPRPTTLLPFITLPNWVKAAAVCGINIERIFTDLGIATDLLHVETATITQAQMDAAMARCVQQSHARHFPFVLGDTFDFDYLPDLQSFVTTSPTLRDAIEVFDWVRIFINPGLSFRLVERGARARLVLHFTNLPPDALPKPWFSESLFAAVLRFGRLLAGGSPFFQKLHFRHPPPDYAAAYEAFFGLPVRFNATEYALEGERVALDKALPGGFATIHAQARERIERRLRLLPRRGGAVSAIEQLVGVQPERLAGGIHAVAEALQLHPRTLQRRLQAEGCSFSALQARLRYRMAREWLSQPEQSIDAISERLGFADRRSFTRAFQRWSGLSPRAWRNRRGDGDGNNDAG